MAPEQSADDSSPLVVEWPFPVSAALGSSVRAKGIEREMLARLPFPDRKRLAVEGDRIRLTIPDGQNERFANASRIVSDVLSGVATLPVLPSEAEDILSISARERQKWTKDGRLRSAGTRTVKLRGRARSVTFHVFDPRHIEDALDRDLPSLWREEDAAAAAENRRRAARKAALTRGTKDTAGRPVQIADAAPEKAPRPSLDGWQAFEAAGLLR